MGVRLDYDYYNQGSVLSERLRRVMTLAVSSSERGPPPGTHSPQSARPSRGSSSLRSRVLTREPHARTPRGTASYPATCCTALPWKHRLALLSLRLRRSLETCEPVRLPVLRHALGARLQGALRVAGQRCPQRLQHQRPALLRR